MLLSRWPPRPFGRGLWAMVQPELVREYGRKAGTCIDAPCAATPSATGTGTTPTWRSGRSSTGSTARPAHGTAPVPRGRDTGDRPVPNGSEGLDPGENDGTDSSERRNAESVGGCYEIKEGNEGDARTGSPWRSAHAVHAANLDRGAKLRGVPQGRGERADGHALAARPKGGPLLRRCAGVCPCDDFPFFEKRMHEVLVRG